GSWAGRCPRAPRSKISTSRTTASESDPSRRLPRPFAGPTARRARNHDPASGRHEAAHRPAHPRGPQARPPLPRARGPEPRAGLSQGQVAKMLGLHRPSVSEAEAGNRNVTAEELAKLAGIYKVSVSWLAGEGDESADPHDDRVQLAARELQKLKPADLERLLA